MLRREKASLSLRGLKSSFFCLASRTVSQEMMAVGKGGQHPLPRLFPPRLAICRSLHDAIDLALNPDRDVIVENAHLPAHGDRSTSERDECSSDVALPEVHGHVGEANDEHGAEVGFGFRVVELELMERAVGSRTVSLGQEAEGERPYVSRAVST